MVQLNNLIGSCIHSNCKESGIEGLMKTASNKDAYMIDLTLDLMTFEEWKIVTNEMGLLPYETSIVHLLMIGDVQKFQFSYKGELTDLSDAAEVNEWYDYLTTEANDEVVRDFVESVKTEARMTLPIYNVNYHDTNTDEAYLECAGEACTFKDAKEIIATREYDLNSEWGDVAKRGGGCGEVVNSLTDEVVYTEDIPSLRPLTDIRDIVNVYNEDCPAAEYLINESIRYNGWNDLRERFTNKICSNDSYVVFIDDDGKAQWDFVE